MSRDVVVTLTYSEREAREVIRAIRYFDSNVTADYQDHDRMGLIATAIQLQLPRPKPEEPTGKFAVVADAQGREWVRTRDNLPGYLGVVWMDPERYNHRKWHDIDAVRVLSEGVVQP